MATATSLFSRKTELEFTPVGRMVYNRLAKLRMQHHPSEQTDVIGGSLLRYVECFSMYRIENRGHQTVKSANVIAAEDVREAYENYDYLVNLEREIGEIRDIVKW